MVEYRHVKSHRRQAQGVRKDLAHNRLPGFDDALHVLMMGQAGWTRSCRVGAEQPSLGIQACYGSDIVDMRFVDQLQQALPLGVQGNDLGLHREMAQEVPIVFKITLDATGRFLSHNELLPVEVGNGFIFHFKVGRVEQISADPG